MFSNYLCILVFSFTSSHPHSENVVQTIQGKSLLTYAYSSNILNLAHATISTNGRPLDATIELWNGPNNSPFKLRAYSDNGRVRSFQTILPINRKQTTVALRNTGTNEFPIHVSVNRASSQQFPTRRPVMTTIQGNALRTYPFEKNIMCVEVVIQTDGGPLNARLEMLQGPTTNKQVVEVYTEDGIHMPFIAALETPHSENVVRIVNTGPVEYPISASVLPIRYIS